VVSGKAGNGRRGRPRDAGVSLCARRTRETQSRWDIRSVSVAERESTASADKAKQAALVAEIQVSDMRWLMADPQGRRFVWRLLAEAGVFNTTYTGEALSSAFMEGKRAQGLKLLGEVMQHCPERFSQMQKEARTNERRNATTGK
jgi:hypothetical protein